VHRYLGLEIGADGSRSLAVRQARQGKAQQDEDVLTEPAAAEQRRREATEYRAVIGDSCRGRGGVILGCAEGCQRPAGDLVGSSGRRISLQRCTCGRPGPNIRPVAQIAPLGRGGRISRFEFPIGLNFLSAYRQRDGLEPTGILIDIGATSNPDPAPARLLYCFATEARVDDRREDVKKSK
jgi:hypothetical protein